MSPPDAPPPRVGTGAGQIELAGVDKAERSAHDPARCATCRGVTPWTPQRRDEAARYAATSGRRICDRKVA